MSDTGSRQANGRFANGNPGGPGRPRNAVTEVATVLDRRGVEVAEELMALTVKRARRGNLRAAEMVLQRMWPKRRNRTIAIELPAGDGLPNLLTEHQALAAAMLSGDVTPQDAEAAVRVLKALNHHMRVSDAQKRAIRLHGTLD